MNVTLLNLQFICRYSKPVISEHSERLEHHFIGWNNWVGNRKASEVAYKQNRVLRLAGLGYTNSQISRWMGHSRNHISNLRKMAEYKKRHGVKLDQFLRKDG